MDFPRQALEMLRIPGQVRRQRGVRIEGFHAVLHSLGEFDEFRKIVLELSNGFFARAPRRSQTRDSIVRSFISLLFQLLEGTMVTRRLWIELTMTCLKSEKTAVGKHKESKNQLA